MKFHIASPIALGTLALLAFAASAQQSAQGSRVPLVITDVSVIDTRLGTTTPDMTVVILENRIVNVGSLTDSVPEVAEVVNGRGKFLMPGLWDMHVHLSYARESALPALVANGVTGVRDMGSDLAELDQWRARISSDDLVGPTIIRAGPMLNGMEFNIYQLAVADASEARTAVRTLHKVGVDFLKLHRRTSREAFFAIADEARMLDLPFTGHIPMTVFPAEASDAGQASIEHTETLFEGTFATEFAGQDQTLAIAQWRQTEASALFSTLVRNGTFVDPTLIAQGHLLRMLESAEPDSRDRYIAQSARDQSEQALAGLLPQAEQFLSERRPFFRELQAVVGLMGQAEVPLLTGSDLSYLHPPGFSLHDELALLVESGVTPKDALRAATWNPAEFLQSQEFGSVSIGRQADLILLDANPLDDIQNTTRIFAVVLRGRYLDRPSLDFLLQEAERLAEVN